MLQFLWNIFTSEPQQTQHTHFRPSALPTGLNPWSSNPTVTGSGQQSICCPWATRSRTTALTRVRPRCKQLVALLFTSTLLPSFLPRLWVHLIVKSSVFSLSWECLTSVFVNSFRSRHFKKMIKLTTGHFVHCVIFWNALDGLIWSTSTDLQSRAGLQFWDAPESLHVAPCGFAKMNKNVSDWLRSSRRFVAQMQHVEVDVNNQRQLTKT